MSSVTVDLIYDDAWQAIRRNPHRAPEAAWETVIRLAPTLTSTEHDLRLREQSLAAAAKSSSSDSSSSSIDPEAFTSKVVISDTMLETVRLLPQSSVHPFVSVMAFFPTSPALATIARALRLEGPGQRQNCTFAMTMAVKNAPYAEVWAEYLAFLRLGVLGPHQASSSSSTSTTSAASEGGDVAESKRSRDANATAASTNAASLLPALPCKAPAGGVELTAAETATWNAFIAAKQKEELSKFKATVKAVSEAVKQVGMDSTSLPLWLLFCALHQSLGTQDGAEKARQAYNAAAVLPLVTEGPVVTAIVRTLLDACAGLSAQTPNTKAGNANAACLNPFLYRPYRSADEDATSVDEEGGMAAKAKDDVVNIRAFLKLPSVNMSSLSAILGGRGQSALLQAYATFETSVLQTAAKSNDDEAGAAKPKFVVPAALEARFKRAHDLGKRENVRILDRSTAATLTAHPTSLWHYDGGAFTPREFPERVRFLTASPDNAAVTAEVFHMWVALLENRQRDPLLLGADGKKLVAFAGRQLAAQLAHYEAAWIEGAVQTLLACGPAATIPLLDRGVDVMTQQLVPAAAERAVLKATAVSTDGSSASVEGDAPASKKTKLEAGASTTTPSSSSQSAAMVEISMKARMDIGSLSAVDAATAVSCSPVAPGALLHYLRAECKTAIERATAEAELKKMTAANPNLPVASLEKMSSRKVLLAAAAAFGDAAAALTPMTSAEIKAGKRSARTATSSPSPPPQGAGAVETVTDRDSWLAELSAATAFLSSTAAMQIASSSWHAFIATCSTKRWLGAFHARRLQLECAAASGDEKTLGEVKKAMRQTAKQAVAAGVTRNELYAAWLTAEACVLDDGTLLGDISKRGVTKAVVAGESSVLGCDRPDDDAAFLAVFADAAKQNLASSSAQQGKMAPPVSASATAKAMVAVSKLSPASTERLTVASKSLASAFGSATAHVHHSGSSLHNALQAASTSAAVYGAKSDEAGVRSAMERAVEAVQLPKSLGGTRDMRSMIEAPLIQNQNQSTQAKNDAARGDKGAKNGRGGRFQPIDPVTVMPPPRVPTDAMINASYSSFEAFEAFFRGRRVAETLVTRQEAHLKKHPIVTAAAGGTGETRAGDDADLGADVDGYLRLGAWQCPTIGGNGGMRGCEVAVLELLRDAARGGVPAILPGRLTAPERDLCEPHRPAAFVDAGAPLVSWDTPSVDPVARGSGLTAASTAFTTASTATAEFAAAVAQSSKPKVPIDFSDTILPPHAPMAPPPPPSSSISADVPVEIQGSFLDPKGAVTLQEVNTTAIAATSAVPAALPVQWREMASLPANPNPPRIADDPNTDELCAPRTMRPQRRLIVDASAIARRAREVREQIVTRGGVGADNARALTVAADEMSAAIEKRLRCRLAPHLRALSGILAQQLRDAASAAGGAAAVPKVPYLRTAWLVQELTAGPLHLVAPKEDEDEAA